MGFGKKEKIKKTQYETENQNLGRAAYPKIQPALDRVGDLTMNPDEYRKNLMDTYYNSDNSAQWSDAQRNIRRNLSNATANNYAATHGGYSSAGQKYYDDVIKYQEEEEQRQEELENKVNAPVYYLLANPIGGYFEFEKNNKNLEKCPKCEGQFMKLKDSCVDKVCHKCRLAFITYEE